MQFLPRNSRTLINNIPPQTSVTTTPPSNGAHWHHKTTLIPFRNGLEADMTHRGGNCQAAVPSWTPASLPKPQTSSELFIVVR
jgi:hypothetical protein